MERKCLKNVSTPKLVSAEPKNTGESSPLSTSSLSNSAEAPSKSSISSIRVVFASSPISQSISGLFIATTFTSPVAVPFLVSEKSSTSFFCLSYTPLNAFPEPIGQFTGQVGMPRSFSISSKRSNVSFASRSILLIKVKIGI